MDTLSSLSDPHPLIFQQQLKKSMQQYFISALTQAKLSPMKMQHGAVIIKDNKIIGKGYNKYFNCSTDEEIFSIHAEVSAIQDAKSKNKNNLSNTTMIVIRYKHKKDGSEEISYSMPCKHCKKIIEKYNIRTIMYS